MSDSEATTRPIPRSPVMALVQWLVLVAVVFVAVAAGMTWLADSVDIPSPVVAAPAEPGASAPPGTAGIPGAAADAPLPPPDFRLATLDGGRLGPPDFAGQVVLVEFWASWCGPCRLQAKYLEELHREFDGRGVEFLAVNAGEDLETVRRYVEKSPFPYPVLLDPEDALSVRYRILGLPTVMIIDRQGEISFTYTGVMPAVKLRHELQEAGAAV